MVEVKRQAIDEIIINVYYSSSVHTEKNIGRPIHAYTPEVVHERVANVPNIFF